MGSNIAPPPGYEHYVDSPSLGFSGPPPGYEHYVDSTPKSVMITPKEESKGFLPSLWGQVNPAEVASGLWEYLKATTPHLVSADEDAQQFKENKAKTTQALDELTNHLKSGDFESAADTAAKYIIPGYEGVSAQYKSGDKAGALGTTVGGLAKLYLMKKLGDAGASAVEGAAGLPAKATAANPTTAMIRAYGPNAVDINTLDQALKDVKSTASGPISSNADLIDAAKNYLQKNRNDLETWKAIPRDIGKQTSGSSIGQAMLDAAGDTLKQENPGAYNAVADRASTWNRNFTVDELEKRLKESNAKLNGYYNSPTGKQNAAIASGLNVAEEEAKARALRDTLYKMLDPENGGAGPREIQKRYGGVANLLNTAIDKQAAIAGQSAVSPLAGLREDIMNHARIFRQGDVSPTNSDAYIEAAMKNVGDTTPHPAPANTPNVKGYLPKAPYTGPPVDTSFVHGVDPTAMDRQYVEGRLLPPASSGIGVSGTTVPDILGRTMRGSGSSGVPLLESNPGAGNTTVNPATREFQVPPPRYQNLRNQGTREVSPKTGTPSSMQGLQRSTDLSEKQIAAIKDAIKDHGTLTRADMSRIGNME